MCYLIFILTDDGQTEYLALVLEGPPLLRHFVLMINSFSFQYYVLKCIMHQLGICKFMLIQGKIRV